MTISQTNITSLRRGAGFSMIDVLVAIVVLATALLALAALQGALTRNTADARARSQIASYAEGLIEQLRSSGYTAIAQGTTTISPSSGTATQKATAATIQTAAGVSGLSTTITTDIYNGSGTTFTKATTGTAAGAVSYKQVDVKAVWTDATGQSRSLSLDTIVDSTQVNQTDQTLVNKPLTISGATAPIVRQWDPRATAGVIPIAIGTSTDTAATNPQPEILGKNGSSIAGVSFKVLTYTSQISNEVVIQQNVDTRVVQCSCLYGAGVTDTTNVFAQPYQATYWDGTKYVSPKATSVDHSSTGVNSAVTQDAFCDICCRDRNDTSSNTDNSIKFDPYDTVPDYNHYRYNASNALVAVPSSDSTNAYLNACRLIRVDGQYRVAVDMHNYFFGLLATTNSGASAIPDPTAVTNYISFVTTYLTNSVPSLAAGSGPQSNATATAAYAAAGLDSPPSIALTGTTDTARKLHARGLYIDYLEPDALAAIDNAITTCPTGTTAATCVLPLLPFTTINSTELALWNSSASTLNVTDTVSSIDDPANTVPSRGVSTALTNSGATANAVATTGVSNSGVVGNLTAWAVDPNDLATTLTDLQRFDIAGGAGSGGGGGGGGTTYYFNVAMSFPTSPSTYNWITFVSNNLPGVTWNGTVSQVGGTGVSDTLTHAWSNQTSSPYTWYWSTSNCTTTTTGNGKNAVTTTTCAPNQVSTTTAAPIGLNFIVKNYNLHTETGGADTATMTDINGTHTCSTTTGALQCFAYPVDLTNITVNGTLTTATSAAYPAGTTDLTGQGAQTIVTIPATVGATPGISSTNSSSPDVITIGFGAPTRTVVPGTCVAQTTGNGKNQTTTYVYQPGVSSACAQ